MIRIGIVGCGRILAAHLRGYRLLREAGYDDFRVTALCSRRRESAEMYLQRDSGPPQRDSVSDIPDDPLAVADEYLSDFQDNVEVQVFTDYREMIARGQIDAVNDFTSHELHHQVGQVALQAGKHLLSQKPLAVTVRAAQQMCAEAERRGLTLGVFENFRFLPATRHLHWAFNGGPAGQPQMVMVGYVASWWAPNLVVAGTPWRHHKATGGGLALDLGVHFFDQIRHVVGEVQAVSAKVTCIEPQRHLLDAMGNVVESIDCDADDTFIAEATVGEGTVCSLMASWAGHGEQTIIGEGMVYYGSRARVTGGQITFDGGDRASLETLYEERASEEQKSHDFPRGIEDSFALSQGDWLEAIRHGRPPQTDGQEGLRDLAAAYALLESDQLGRRVTLDEVLSGDAAEYQRPINEKFGLL